MIEQDLSEEEQIAAIELEARLAFPDMPQWKANCEFAVREGRGMLARIKRGEAACRSGLSNSAPARRAFRDADQCS